MTWFRTFKQAMAALPILAIVILASNVTAKAIPSLCVLVSVVVRPMLPEQ